MCTINTERDYSQLEMKKEYRKETIKEFAKATKNTDRLFRIIVPLQNGNSYGVYLFRGKFYKSDVFNIHSVIAKEKPSVANLSSVYLNYIFEIVDEKRKLYNL